MRKGEHADTPASGEPKPLLEGGPVPGRLQRPGTLSTAMTQHRIIAEYNRDKARNPGISLSFSFFREIQGLR